MKSIISWEENAGVQKHAKNSGLIPVFSNQSDTSAIFTNILQFISIL